MVIMVFICVMVIKIVFYIIVICFFICIMIDFFSYFCNDIYLFICHMVIRQICFIFCIMVIMVFNYLFIHNMIIRITLYFYIVTMMVFIHLFTLWYLEFFLHYDNIFIYLCYENYNSILLHCGNDGILVVIIIICVMVMRIIFKCSSENNMNDKKKCRNYAVYFTV